MKKALTILGVIITSFTSAQQINYTFNGGNGSGGLADYGISTAANSGQASLGAEGNGDICANLNLGTNISGTRRFWHISKRTSSENHNLNFYFFDGSAFQHKLTFASNGNVGIGTSLPSFKFHIRGANPNSDLMTLGATTTGNFALTDVGGGAYGLFAGISNTGRAWLQAGRHDANIAYDLTLQTAGGNVGIGITAPVAKLHVHDDTELPQAAGSYQLLERISGRGFNYFIRSNWLPRDASSTTQWWTTRLHDGLSIDGSFLTPGTDTKTWWERDPYDNVQSWGNANQTYLTINQGNVGIGTTAPDAKLAVNGTIHSKEVKVDLTNWPDYVFEPTYNLPSLDSIKTYIDQHKHLPEVPSAKEMEANGVNLGEMNMLLLKKIEELTLYVIEQNKEMEQLEKKVKTLELTK